MFIVNNKNTKTLESSGNIPFDKLLFIAFDNGCWHKTLVAITSRGDYVKTNSFFESSALRSLNITSACFC